MCVGTVTIMYVVVMPVILYWLVCLNTVFNMIIITAISSVTIMIPRNRPFASIARQGCILQCMNYVSLLFCISVYLHETRQSWVDSKDPIPILCPRRNKSIVALGLNLRRPENRLLTFFNRGIILVHGNLLRTCSF
jgi:hypothetical protein